MKKDFFQRIYEKNPDVVFRVIAGETVLVPISKETQTLGRLFTLNEVGAFIWGKIDGKRDLAGIIREVKEEYDVSEKTARRDLVDLIEALEEVEALRLAPGS